MTENKKIEVGDVFEGCNFHPLRCTEISYEDDYINGVSLLDNVLRSCSLNNCGVFKMTTQEIEESIQIYTKHGEEGLIKRWDELK